VRHVLVLNGPNLNLLGVREPEVYGSATLADIGALCRAEGLLLGLVVDFRQTNAEHEMLAWIHAARGVYNAIAINAAAWTHTSIALHDALKTFDGPVVEVHLSEPMEREAFRHTSYIEPLAAARFAGMGPEGYVRALAWIAQSERPGP
jgi:3-dehydroquinate dehydratase-2